jgi:excisionase family DNA binding protein
VLLHLSEVAQELATPISTVNQLVASGELTCVTVGGRRRVSQRELDSYVLRSTARARMHSARFDEADVAPAGLSFGAEVVVVWPEVDGCIVVSDSTGRSIKCEVIR